MKKLLTIITAFILSFSVFGQDIISESQTIVARQDIVVCQGDTSTRAYYLVTTQVVDNGTPHPDTTRASSLIKEGDCPADSSQVARQLFVGAINQQLQLSGHMSEALQRAQILQAFNNVNTLYQQFVGIGLIDAISIELFSGFTGVYRVFTSTGSFFADLKQLPNGRWRLRQLTGPKGTATGTEWVMNPRSPNNFSIKGLDLGFGATNYEFYRDQRRGAQSIFWPTQRITGSTGAARIVKLN